MCSIYNSFTETHKIIPFHYELWAKISCGAYKWCYYTSNILKLKRTTTTEVQ